MGGIEPAAELCVEFNTSLSLLYSICQLFVPIEEKEKKKKKKVYSVHNQ